MAEINLTQLEADLLIAMEKHSKDNDLWEYPGLGGSLSVPLISADKKENFFLDIRRTDIGLKGTYQNRARQVVVLVRLDFGGQPHRNPDDIEVPSPHLHMYREGYADKWAVAIPFDKFPNIDDPWKTLHDFMSYCNITQPPHIERGLFL
jgi:hypothetical protein